LTALGGEYFIDNTFSIVDISMGYSLSVAYNLKFLEEYPVLKKYFEKLSEMDSFKRATSPEEDQNIKNMRANIKKEKQQQQELLSKEQKSKAQTKLTLFHIPGTRSTRIAWLLNELEIEYEHVDPFKKSLTYFKSDEYSKINPNFYSSCCRYKRSFN